MPGQLADNNNNNNNDDDVDVELPVKGVECVDVPAVLVEAAHAVRSPVAEEPVQDCHLLYSNKKRDIKLESESIFLFKLQNLYFHIPAGSFYCAIFENSHHLLFKMSMGLFLKFRALEVFS